MDWYHVLAAAKAHVAKFKAVYIVGLVTFWPLALLLPLSPVYGVLYERVSYLVVFGCAIVLFGFVWISTVQQATEFVQSTLSVEDRRKCILVYAACGACPALCYLPLVFWAPTWQLALLSLVALSLACSAILFSIAFLTLHNTGVPTSISGAWWLSPEILLVSCLALPVIADGRPVAMVSLATMAYGTRRWIRRHEFMISATKHASVVWFGCIFALLGTMLVALSPSNQVSAGVGAILVGPICWYWYSAFRFGYALVSLVAIIEMVSR